MFSSVDLDFHIIFLFESQLFLSSKASDSSLQSANGWPQSQLICILDFYIFQQTNTIRLFAFWISILEFYRQINTKDIEDSSLQSAGCRWLLTISSGSAVRHPHRWSGRPFIHSHICRKKFYRISKIQRCHHVNMDQSLWYISWEIENVGSWHFWWLW